MSINTPVGTRVKTECDGEGILEHVEVIDNGRILRYGVKLDKLPEYLDSEHFRKNLPYYDANEIEVLK